MTKIALITARGGSKGLPRKNILPINGHPLIAWTIKAALQSSAIDEVYVSTEDSEIIEISLKYGAKIINRPIELSGDDVGSDIVISHFINTLESEGIAITTIFLLQPTSPLRTSKNIDEAYKLYNEKSANCVLSVFEPQHTPAKAYKLNDNGTIEGLLRPDAPYTRRQDLPSAFQPNGAIYIFNKNVFMLNNYIPRTKVYPYIMNEESSIDIDIIDDLLKAEKYLERNNND